MPPPPHGPAATPWLTYLGLGAGMALVGSVVGLAKLPLAVFPVLLLARLRFAIAAPAMLACAAAGVVRAAGAGGAQRRAARP